MTAWQTLTVAELLPQAPPMVLLDRVVAYTGDALDAEFAITERSLFFDAALQGVPAWAGIEYMAQAVAALGGLHAREAGQTPRIGFLLGTRKLLLPEKLLQCGATYRVQVRQLFSDAAGLASFDCRILRGAHVCVEAAINIFVPPDAGPHSTTSTGIPQP